MERLTFLKSLPYLYPLSSQEWPPKPNNINTEISANSTVIIISCSLSVEPNFAVIGEHHISAGPVYFSNSQEKEEEEEQEEGVEQDDPTLFSFEMALLPWQLQTKNTSPSSMVATTPKSSSSPPDYSSLNVTEYMVYFRMDKKYLFGVDFTKITNVILCKDSNKLPPSVLIYFTESEVFRLFFNNRMHESNYERLQKFQSSLLKWLNGETLIDFSMNSPNNSGSSGSGPSSAEHGQAENSSITTDEDDKDSSPKKSSSNAEDAIKLKKRKLAHVDTSWEAMKLLFNSSQSHNSDNNDKLLNLSAKHYTNSYIDSKTLLHSLDSRHNETLEKLNQTITKIFPTPNQTKLQSRAQKQQVRTSLFNNNAVTDLSVEHIQQMMKDYQDSVKLKHEVCCLPQR